MKKLNEKKILIDSSSLVESFDYKQNEKGEKIMFIEGLFSKSDVVNGNRRNYPKAVLKYAINEMLPRIKKRSVTGELGHPDERLETIPEREAILITEISWDDVKGEAWGVCEVLNYGPGSHGFMLEKRIERKIPTGISSRATGSLSNSDVQGVSMVNEDLEIYCYDVVCEPSNPGSWLNLKEGKWLNLNEAMLYEKVLEESKKCPGKNTMDRDCKKLLYQYFDEAIKNATR